MVRNLVIYLSITGFVVGVIGWIRAFRQFYPAFRRRSSVHKQLSAADWHHTTSLRILEEELAVTEEANRWLDRVNYWSVVLTLSTLGFTIVKLL